MSGATTTRMPVTLAMILGLLRIEPRVIVDLDPGAFWYRTWGRNLFGVCHGHTVKKVDDLPSIMAAIAPVEWGAAHRRWLLGHFHNSSMKERRGCSVEVFRTLAPPMLGLRQAFTGPTARFQY